jgi:hypothetical protein
MTDLGASIAWVGLTFTLFGLPMMVVSPFAGRLVDRLGSSDYEKQVEDARIGCLVESGEGYSRPGGTEPAVATDKQVYIRQLSEHTDILRRRYSRQPVVNETAKCRRIYELLGSQHLLGCCRHLEEQVNLSSAIEETQEQ